MPSVPPEVEMDILSRVPVKSLIRFRCVCKNWLALLTTDTHFINLHLKHSVQSHKQNPNILLQELGLGRKAVLYSEPNFEQSIVFKSPVKRAHLVVGCCNGILCLKHTKKDDTMFLWNPATGEQCVIPSICPVYDKTAYFDFGFTEDTNQYKVVRISARAEFTVHTIGTSAWRSLGKIPYLINRLSYSQKNVPVNGALHWILQEEPQYPSRRAGRYVLVYFGLKQEVFGKMTLPCDHGALFLAKPGASICLLHGSHDIWVMQDYGVVSSWTKIVSIVEPVGYGCGPLGGMKIVGYWNNGDFIVWQTDEYLLFYNRGGQLIKRIDCSISKSCEAYTYTGSLVSPRFIAGVGPEDDKSKLIQSGRKRKRFFRRHSNARAEH